MIPTTRTTHIPPPPPHPNTNATSDAGASWCSPRCFTLFELEQDPTLLLDLKDDVREECTDKIGGVTNVVCGIWSLKAS